MAEPESKSSPVTTSDSDNEYEYTNETEDFYFTLDVASHQSLAALKPNQSKNNQKSKGKQSARPGSSLQVLDLHSNNPLVKVGDSFYSCHWSTDLGTQFYLTKPGVVEEPLRRGYVLDVVGLSRARLTGAPVTLHRRRSDAAEKTIGSSTTNAIILDDGDQASSGASPIDLPSAQQQPMNESLSQLATARQNARDPLVKAQASFLERLAIIKHQKGETDNVPVHGVEELTGPHQSNSANTATLSTSNSKRKSVSDDMHEEPANGEPSRKRHVSETRIAEDGDGASPIAYPQSRNWNAELSFHEDRTSVDDIGPRDTSEGNASNGQPSANANSDIAGGQTP